MAGWRKLLARMRNNPRDGWCIEDIQRVAKNVLAVMVRPPTRGDHYKVSHPDVREILTIPANRPIKPVYVKQFVSMMDSIIGEDAENLEDGVSVEVGHGDAV